MLHRIPQLRVEKKPQSTKFRLRASPQHPKVLQKRGLHRLRSAKKGEGVSGHFSSRTSSTRQGIASRRFRSVRALVASPRLRSYKKHRQSAKVLGGLGGGVIFHLPGCMSNRDARKQGVGRWTLLCYIFTGYEGHPVTP